AVLIVAEHDGARLNASTAKCVRCAGELRPEAVDVAVLGAGTAAVAAEAATLTGVRRVLHVDRPENREPLAAILAPQIAALAHAYTHVLGPGTTFGKDVLPRVAALLGVGMLSDVMAVEGPHRFRRPIYAGNAIVTVEAPADSILVASVRTASYAEAPRGGSAPIETPAVDVPLPAHTRFVERASGSAGERPDLRPAARGLPAAAARRASGGAGERAGLQTAARVVAGGRALGSAEQFVLVQALADRLGAAVGASRAAVDAGLAPNELQIGQTGKVIAPELYVAIGIS